MVSFCVWERAKSAQTLSCRQEKNKQPPAEGWRPQAARWTWVLCGGQVCLSQALLGSLSVMVLCEARGTQGEGVIWTPQDSLRWGLDPFPGEGSEAGCAR